MIAPPREPSLIELIREDYRSNGCDWHRPGFRAIAVYRFGVWRMSVRNPAIRFVLSKIYRFLERRCSHVYGIEIPFATKIGRRLTIEHQHGIVIHGASVIGNDCVIRQGVTLGIRDEAAPFAAPQLGDRVSVGAGAKILGEVKIHDGAKIGANAVVLSDVPKDASAVGIPARIIEKSSDKEEHHSTRGTRL